MPRPLAITSRANPAIKQAVALQKRSVRDEDQLMIVEGVREIELALEHGFVPTTFFTCPTILRSDPAKQLARKIQHLENIQLYETTKDVFEKITYPENPCGILGLFRYKIKTLTDFTVPDPALFFVLETVEKPVNLGALLRLGDGVGVQGILVCDASTDVFNHHVIRTSTGAIFTVPFCQCTSQDALVWLATNSISVVATTPNTTKIYTDLVYSKRCALALGSEKDGLTPLWLGDDVTPVVIPMRGIVNSLNVAQSAGIVAYEILRQWRANA